MHLQSVTAVNQAGLLIGRDSVTRLDRPEDTDPIPWTIGRKQGNSSLLKLTRSLWLTLSVSWTASSWERRPLSLPWPKPESTEPSGGGAGTGHGMDGEGIVQADGGWTAPVAGLLSA